MLDLICKYSTYYSTHKINLIYFQKKEGMGMVGRPYGFEAYGLQFKRGNLFHPGSGPRDGSLIICKIVRYWSWRATSFYSTNLSSFLYSHLLLSITRLNIILVSPFLPLRDRDEHQLLYMFRIPSKKPFVSFSHHNTCLRVPLPLPS